MDGSTLCMQPTKHKIGNGGAMIGLYECSGEDDQVWVKQNKQLMHKETKRCLDIVKFSGPALQL